MFIEGARSPGALKEGLYQDREGLVPTLWDQGGYYGSANLPIKGYHGMSMGS